MAQDDKTGQALQRYEDTSLAFDNMIVQVGRALAKAQESLDRRQVEFQKEVARALTEGRITNLDVIPLHNYLIPETKLEIKIGMSIRYPEGGGAPSISVVPLNATTTGQSDVSIQAASEVKLRFVSVPQAKENPGAPPSRMTGNDVSALLAADPAYAAARAALLNPVSGRAYAENPHLWIAADLEGREPGLVSVVDDRTSKIVACVAKRSPPTAMELEPVRSPIIGGVTPPTARQGELVTVHGDNFLTLGGQTLLTVDEIEVPIARLSMRALSFRMPAMATSGNVVVATANGDTGAAGAALFTPLPSIRSIDPPRGYYDAIRAKGSLVAIQGANLRYGCKVRFANGVMTLNEQVLSAAEMQVEVPEGAGSGPLTLVYGINEDVLEQPFFILPRVARVTPRQGRVGEPVTLAGNALDGVTELAMGPVSIPRREFLLQTPDQIRFAVPSGAIDGPIRVRTVLGAGNISEVVTRDLFYVVPKIVQLGQTVTYPGAALSITAEGLDADRDMMTLLFDAVGGISEAPVLSSAPERRMVMTRVPDDAAAGYVQLIRKRVYSGSAHAETTGESFNKITIVSNQNRVRDVIVDERFDGTLERWTASRGTWRIEDGRLIGTGDAQLRLTQPEFAAKFPLRQVALYADVLNGACFGCALQHEPDKWLETWVTLEETGSTVSWIEVDAAQRQTVLRKTQTVLPPDVNYLLQLVLSNGTATLLLNQQSVDQYPVGDRDIRGAAVLSNALSNAERQRWDNIIIVKGDFLVLPGAKYYRFSDIDEGGKDIELRIDGFSPAGGQEGMQVELAGAGFDQYTRVFFGGAEAEIIRFSETEATVRVPKGATSGPIELRSSGDISVSTGIDWFLLPPTILNLVPRSAYAGDLLIVSGFNLLAFEGIPEVRIMGRAAIVAFASPTMLAVTVPDVSGSAPVTVTLSGLSAQSPMNLQVCRERTVLDMLEGAGKAVWSTGVAAVGFGAAARYGSGAVQLRGTEKLEDGLTYRNVLYVQPPDPSANALWGEFPAVEMPTGKLEVHIAFGMLASAKPLPDEMALVDGVIFEVGFELEDTGEFVQVLPRTLCVHDGVLERFVLDGTPLAGRRGQMAIKVMAGRNGFRDEAGIVEARVVTLD